MEDDRHREDRKTSAGNSEMQKDRQGLQNQSESVSLEAEYVRKKYYYRSLIVKGKARVGEKLKVRRLVGPDCAYHLYSYMKNNTGEKESVSGDSSTSDNGSVSDNGSDKENTVNE